jgi:outer membrane protein assembly factor BamB
MVNNPSVRWWPAVAVVAAGSAAWCWVWLVGPDRSNQDRMILTIPIALGVPILLAIWLAFFSRVLRATKVRAAFVVLALLAIAGATTRIRGVTGDLAPIFEWRWSRRPAPAFETLPAPAPTAAQPAAAPSTASVPMSQTAAGSPSAPSEQSGPSAAPAPSSPLSLSGPDYPQYLGPNRNGTLGGIRLATDWTASPPRLVWRRRLGAGWSGFAVADGLAVTQEQRGEHEMVVAYALADGAPRWAHGDKAHFESTVAGEGPRATPTISRGRVFTLGSTGILNALDLRTGKLLWQRHVGTDNDSAEPDWGRSSSPLAVDDLVIVSVGGTNGRSLVAYDRESGKPMWHGGDDRPSYSSPQLATLAGVRQVLIMNRSTISSHDPATGRVLWEHDWPRQDSVAQPIVISDNRVLFSAGYGIGSRLLEIAGADGALGATLVWESTRLKAKFANLVLHDGYVYGLDDGVLVCLDPADGARKWKAGRYGHGQVILAGELLLVQTEDGELVLVEPRPDAHRELARLPMFMQKTWNPPALAGRFLLVRNDVEAALFELAERAVPRSAVEPRSKR